MFYSIKKAARYKTMNDKKSSLTRPIILNYFIPRVGRIFLVLLKKEKRGTDKR